LAVSKSKFAVDIVGGYPFSNMNIQRCRDISVAFGRVLQLAHGYAQDGKSQLELIVAVNKYIDEAKAQLSKITPHILVHRSSEYTKYSYKQRICTLMRTYFGMDKGCLLIPYIPQTQIERS
jgi:hypothetical protein